MLDQLEPLIERGQKQGVFPRDPGRPNPGIRSRAAMLSTILAAIGEASNEWLRT